MKYSLCLLLLLSLVVLGVSAQTVTEFSVATGNDSTFAWGIASSGTNFLIPIVGNSSSQYSFTAQLLSSNGTLQGSALFLNAYGFIEQALWDGTRYFVVYLTASNELYGQFVTKEGTLDGSPLLIASTVNLKEGSQILTQLNQEFLVLYIKNDLLYGQRIQKTGTLVGSPIQISASGATKEFAVATDGSRYFVIWFNKNSQDGNNAIYGRILNADGTMFTEIFTIEAPNPDHNPVSLAFDGTNYYLSYDLPLNYSSPAIHGIFGRFISPTGTVGERITICSTATVSNSISSVGYGNGTYLVTWLNWVNSSEGIVYLKGKYINTSGAALSNEFTIAAPLSGKIPLGLSPLYVNNTFLMGFNRVSISQNGQFTDGDVYYAVITGASSAVQQSDGVQPKQFALYPNYPNPFNPTTTMRFTLAHDGFTTLKVYNILGKEVATLMRGNLVAGKNYDVVFDGTNLPSGIYFARLESGKQSQVLKIVLLK